MSRFARRLSVELLNRWFLERPVLDALLQSPKLAELDPRDGRLVSEIVYGVLRNLSRIDFYIRQLSGRSLGKIDPVVLALLRSGLYQLEFHRTPPRAVVHETVELCRESPKSSAAGFVNAILRRFQSSPPRLPQGNSSFALSLRFSHPQWLVTRFLKRHGVELSEKLLAANNQPPRPVVWVNPFQYSREEFCRLLEQAEIPCTPLEELESAVEIHSPSFVRHPLYRQGACFFMDPASQAVAELVPVEGRCIVGDLCAAPGGKSFILASRKDRSARLICADASLKRLKEMQRRAEIYRIPGLHLFQADVERALPLRASLDSILLDVPCSGLGTIRSNPDIRWKIQESDLARFHQRQLLLLSNAFHGLKEGGILTYSTCSSEPEENEQVVDEFLRRERRAERLSPDFRSLPEGLAGGIFFAARIRRI